MGLITEEVEVKVNFKLIPYYKNLGYECSKGNDVITVNIKDLTKSSSVIVQCLCDYCNKNIIEMTYKQYNRSMSDIVKKIACKECVNKKRKEKSLLKYGVEHHMQLETVKEKQRNVFREKYGVDYPMQSKEIMDKSRASYLKKYGVDNPLKSKEIRNKIAETCTEKYGTANPFQSEKIKEKIKTSMINKYGVDNPMKSPEIKNKAMETCVAKYGVEHVLQNEEIMQTMFQNNMEKYGVKYISQIPEVRKKVIESLYKNNTQCTSNQQRYIASLYNMELNYPILYWTVDMYDKDNSICVEYDGKGHQLSVELGQETQENFNKKELVREKLIRQEGYKMVRIISRQDWMPSDSTLLQMLMDAKQYFKDYPEHSWMNFDIDNQTVKNAEYERSYFYGELRKIKKTDLETA